MMPRVLKKIVFGVVFAGALTACAGIPFQEMSDARQAVEAARQAGARSYSPKELLAAENLLQRAEEALSDGLFRQAREAAEAAREKAVSAQANSPD